MITIITGTNRKNSECLTFARKYREILQTRTEEKVCLLELENIPHDWFHAGMYDRKGQVESITRLQDEYLVPAGKFVFIIPEYNGSFPGALKLFIDACSVRKYTETFKGKKAALLGIASGRAGNLRGMDHLADVLNHLGVIVLPNKLPVSRIEKLMDSSGEIIDEATLRVMEDQAREILAF